LTGSLEYTVPGVFINNIYLGVFACIFRVYWP